MVKNAGKKRKRALAAERSSRGRRTFEEVLITEEREFVQDGDKDRVESQTSIEYLATFSVALSIVLVAIYILFGTTAGITAYAGQTCQFGAGVSCSDLILASNSTTTMFGILGSNSQKYSIKNLNMSVSFGGNSTKLQCTPSTIKAGQPFICSGKISAYERAGLTVGGSLAVRVAYCGLNGGGCNNTILENYAGTYTTFVAGTSVMKLGIQFSQPVYGPGGKLSIGVLLNVFGQLTPISTLNISSSGKVTSTGNEAAYVTTTTPKYVVSCADVVQASYAGLTTLNQTLVIAPQTYTSSSLSIITNNNQQSYSFTNPTSLGVAANYNNICVLAAAHPVTTLIVAPGLAGFPPVQYNNVYVAGGNVTSVTLAGNNNNVRMINGNVGSITISGSYDKMYLSNGNANTITMSGSNERVYLQSATYITKSITGTNDSIVIT